MSLSEGLRNKLRQARPKEPIWGGPSDVKTGGITYSLLCKFLVDRERFRLLTVKGLKGSERWDHKMGYGNLWHVGEEALSAGKPWQEPMQRYAQTLLTEHPMEREQIAHWYAVCREQFPIYIDFWKHHPEIAAKKPIFQEKVFGVLYNLPSGRSVILRGKFDAVDDLSFSKLLQRMTSGLYVQENKSKGNVKQEQIVRHLKFDLQTMLYLVALEAYCKNGNWNSKGDNEPPLRGLAGRVPVGIRYNVIRRPLSGGLGNIVRHQATQGSKCPKCGAGEKVDKKTGEKLLPKDCPKCMGAGRLGGKSAETEEHFYNRVAEYIRREPETYFFRWTIDVSPEDVRTFRDQCLDPILEQLCDWWEWISFCVEEKKNIWDNDVSFGARPDKDDNGRHASAIHWRHPFGVYNSLNEGGATDLDFYLETGSEEGLRRVTNLFPELTA